MRIRILTSMLFVFFSLPSYALDGVQQVRRAMELIATLCDAGVIASGNIAKNSFQSKSLSLSDEQHAASHEKNVEMDLTQIVDFAVRATASGVLVLMLEAIIASADQAYGPDGPWMVRLIKKFTTVSLIVPNMFSVLSGWFALKAAESVFQNSDTIVPQVYTMSLIGIPLAVAAFLQSYSVLAVILGESLPTLQSLWLLIRHGQPLMNARVHAQEHV